jgi:hypothetical protein
LSGIYVHFCCLNLYNKLIIIICPINCPSLNQELNECIPDDNQNFKAYPIYSYVGTTSHDYQMASFVLGKISVTIMKMHAVFPPDHADIGTRQVGITG